MAQSSSLYENERSRMINSLIHQWNDAYRSQNIVRMATVLRYAAKMSYSQGNKENAKLLICYAMNILPKNSPLFMLTSKDAAIYAVSNYNSIENSKLAGNEISKIITSL